MVTESADFVRVADADEVRADGRELVDVGDRSLALFYDDGEFWAVDNRCPHMGYPLVEGDVDDGVLTCQWHHVQFELACGATFHPRSGDVGTYPVEVRDGDVYVKPRPSPERPPSEHWQDRLRTGLERNYRLVLAKSVVGLFDAGVEYRVPLRRGLEFGCRHRQDGWGEGLTVTAAMANVLPDLRPADRKRALYTGLCHVAEECSDEPPAFDRSPFPSNDIAGTQLGDRFRDRVDIRDADGAERCLRTALETTSRQDVVEMLFGAATDHLFMDGGRVLAAVDKAFEALDHVGWEHADEVLPSLVPRLANATRSDDRYPWKQPTDRAGLLFDAFDDLPDLVAEGDGAEWRRPDDFTETLLGDGPRDIADSMTTAIREGATAEQLAREVAYAAISRVARFGVATQFNDSATVARTLVYVNAVHGASRRVDAPSAYRGVLTGAMSVNLDDFLNRPPTPIPDPDGSDRDPGTIRADLRETFDRESGGRDAGELVAEHFAADGDPAELKRTLGHALLREDAPPHALLALEAGFRQFDLQHRPERERDALVAVARHVDEHVPTRRETEQPFDVAARLHRGESVHEADGDRRSGE